MKRATQSHIGRITELSRTIALTEAGTFPHGILSTLGGGRWPEARSSSLDETSRHLAAKGASLVVIAGETEAWLMRAISICRAAGRFPIAALFAPDEGLAVDMLRAGATVTVDATQSLEDIATQLIAVFESSTPTHSGLDVRLLEAEGLRLDIGARRCELAGERISLSVNEFDLLHYLMTHAQDVVPSARITADLWNIPTDAGLNMLRLNITRLRKKLGDAPRAVTYIESVRGIGYQFRLPVAEVGQERSDVRLRHTVATLNAQHDGLYDLLESLRAAATIPELATSVVEWATGRGFADAATVFRFEQRNGREHSQLLASSGMSTRWRQSIALGHPVDESFIASAAYLRGSVIQLSDMSRPGSRFPTTVSMSSAENLHACLIFPLTRDAVIWGDVGFLSRERRAFPPSRVRFLRAVADMMSIALSNPPRQEEAWDADI